MKNFKEVQVLVYSLGQKINAPKGMLVLRSEENSSGSAYIVIDESYNYINSERGYLISKKQTKDLDEFLYWIFSSVTFQMASDFELMNREKSHDSRKTLFAEQLRLLSIMNDEWEKKREEEILNILRKNPYMDKNESQDKNFIKRFFDKYFL